MKTVLAGLGLVAMLSTSAASQEMSVEAQDVMNAHRVKLCDKYTD